jgi:serine/threonine protein kinase
VKLFSPDQRFTDIDRLRSRFRLEQWFTNRFIFSSLLTGWYGTWKNFDYIVYDDLCDFDLKTVIRNPELLRSIEPISVITDICSAVTFLHANGVVHRDLKPSNILLLNGRALVGDFGVARDLAKDSDTETHSSDLVGSRDYIAPEQRNNPRSATPKSDIYSLGVIFYELLTGYLPSYNYDPVEQYRPDWGFLDGIIKRMLSRAPEHRYESVPQVVRAILRQWVNVHSTASITGLWTMPYEKLLFVKRWLELYPDIPAGFARFRYQLHHIEDHIAFFSYCLQHPHVRVLKIPIPHLDFEMTVHEQSTSTLKKDADLQLTQRYRSIVAELLTANRAGFIESGFIDNI